jgi:hypothetical protein
MQGTAHGCNSQISLWLCLAENKRFKFTQLGVPGRAVGMGWSRLPSQDNGRNPCSWASVEPASDLVRGLKGDADAYEEALAQLSRTKYHSSIASWWPFTQLLIRVRLAA